MPNRPEVTRFSIQEGVTADLNYQLQNDTGAGAADYDLTGKTVTLQVQNQRGMDVSPGTVSVVTASEGKIKIAPNGGFVAADSPYRGRFKVTDGSSKDDFWPNGNGVIEWEVTYP